MSVRIKALEAELKSDIPVERMIDTLNVLAWELRDHDGTQGLEYAQRAYRLAEEAQYPKGCFASLIAQCQFTNHEFDAALTHGYQALVVFEQHSDIAWQSRTLFTLSWAHWFADNFVEAIEFGRRAQSLAHAIQDQVLEADVLNNLGLSYKRSGNYALAYAVYGEALTLYRGLGNTMRAAKVLVNMALAYAAEGNFEQAQVLIDECQTIEIQNRIIDGYICLAQGQVYAGFQRYSEALEILEQAIQVGDEFQLEQLTQIALHTIGQVYLDQRQPDLAIAYIQRALDQAVRIESGLSSYRCHEALAKIYEDQGDFARALAHFKQFHTIKETLFNERNIGRLQYLQSHHDAELARHQVEIQRLKNIQLEKEITERKRLQRILQEQATTDSLTGVANRRHFLDLARQEFQRARLDGLPLALALIDLDHFKKVNDTYGHAVGDQVLIALANTCLHNIREFDAFARLGGDEFVMLLGNTGCEQAYKILERVRQILHDNPFHSNSGIFRYTISTGIVCLAAADASMEDFMLRADRALFEAKKAGRNQIVVIEE